MWILTWFYSTLVKFLSMFWKYDNELDDAPLLVVNLCFKYILMQIYCFTWVKVFRGTLQYFYFYSSTSSSWAADHTRSVEVEQRWVWSDRSEVRSAHCHWRRSEVRAHRLVWGRSSCGFCLCLSAWRRSSSAGARPWWSFSSSSSSVLPDRRRRVWQEQRGVSAPSSCSGPSFLFTLSHNCDSSLALRAAEQEMNSTHSFPKFPSPPPPPPPVPPPTLPPATGREGGSGLMGNVVLWLQKNWIL